MATAPHQRNKSEMPAGLLAIVVVVAAIAAVIPFAIVLGGLELGASFQTLDFILGGVTVFILLFPLALRFATPRRDHRYHAQGAT